MSKNSSLKETGPSYSQNFDNPAQNILHKIKKYSKIGQDLKSVISKSVEKCFF